MNIWLISSLALSAILIGVFAAGVVWQRRRQRDAYCSNDAEGFHNARKIQKIFAIITLLAITVSFIQTIILLT